MIYFLIIYAIFLIGYIIYSFFGLYHLWRFGYIGDLTKPAIVLYIVVSIIVIVISLVTIALRPWPNTLSF